MIDQPIHVSDSEFEERLLKSDLPVIVDFWAPWCGPCRMLAPMLEKVAKERAGRLIIAKVNTDEHPQWAIHYGVQGIPTMLFIRQGELIEQQVGVLPEPQLRQIIDEFLAVDLAAATG